MRDEAKLDRVIKGGNVVLQGGVRIADIAIQAGVIVDIGPDIQTPTRQTIDAQGLYVMAGVVDAHVHLNEPGLGEWEGFESGSAALAAGGCTTFFDMPSNGPPPTLTVEAMNRKLQTANRTGSYVDYALWGGLVPDNLDDLEALADAGVIGFKAFMSAPGDKGEGCYKEVDDIVLFEGMKIIAGKKKVLAVHAESEEIIAALSEKFDGRKKRSVRDFLESRPLAAELDAVRRVLLFAERTECPLHLVHISSPQAVDMIWEAKMNGVNVTVETCPHYLMFTDDDLERLGPLAKCAPPIRGLREREGLWTRLAEGKIDLIASDHSPCPPSMKLNADEDYFAIWGGIAGAQSTLELMFDEGHLERGLPLPLLSKLLSEAPARRFGLFPRKGRLAVGADADIVLVHPDSPYVLEREHLQYRHRQSVYAGRSFRSRVVMTMSRGKTVYTKEEGIGASRDGEWQRAKRGSPRSLFGT
ncbi:allantoinase AllB [Cohnella cholangitidis]|uniref:Allantoinase n=1 Tax=Cohnella cholangitidis TaxID=2598458 RepID=A0A7G5C1R1_9BACL|nr:allantoinase AllB [Cohnella cholangitidis]QMV43145.1 allantoinase AllB [Cohnella cholangitidis]